MWILKGIFAGSAFFLLFTFLYIRRIVGPLPKDGTSIGIDVRSFSFTANPPYWLLFIMLIVSACFWFRLLEKVTPVTLP